MNRTRKLKITLTLILALFILLLSLHDTLADTVISEERGAVYDTDSVSPFMTYFRNNDESVNMDTGNLNLSVTDLTLPGRGGLDFKLTRTFSSGNGVCYIPGLRADSSQRAYVATLTNNIYFDHISSIGVGWSFNFPSVEYDFGVKYLHMGDGTIYEIKSDNSLKKYYVKDIVYTVESGTVTRSINGNTTDYPYTSYLKTKEGLQYFFSSGGSIQVIKNRFGDMICFNYDNISHKINTIIDSVGRTITFDFSNSPTKVTVNTGSISIEYIMAVADLNRQTENGLITKYNLDKVIYKSIGGIEPDDDRTVSYSYSLQPASFRIDVFNTYSDGAPGVNYYLTLDQVTNTGGGVTKYQYLFLEKPMYPDDSSNDSTIYKPFLSRRADSTGGKEYSISQFYYNRSDSDGKYNQRDYLAAAWDTQSQPKQLTEKYYFNSNH